MILRKVPFYYVLTKSFCCLQSLDIKNFYLKFLYLYLQINWISGFLKSIRSDTGNLQVKSGIRADNEYKKNAGYLVNPYLKIPSHACFCL
jgi:hypothetical protein